MQRRALGTGFRRVVRGFRSGMLAAATFVLASCLTGPPRQPATRTVARPLASAPARAPRPWTVVLVTLDGVRWQEVFDGVDRTLAEHQGLGHFELVSANALMPNLHALTEASGALLGAGASGSAISASGPDFVSLPGYSEILAGRRRTACKNNGCSGADATTLLDDLVSAPGLRQAAVAMLSSWPDIGRVATRHPERIAMSTGRHGGSTRELFRYDDVSAALLAESSTASPEPGQGDFRPDEYTARIALRYLERVHPRFLFVALGEPDEYAHRSDYRGYLRALRRADLFIGQLGQTLAELGARGSRTLLVVTTDHGRAANFKDHGAGYPESARVWLLAAGTEIHARGVLSGAGPHRLADIAPTIRFGLGLPRDQDAHAGAGIAELL